jgi:hypothetical protein
LKRGRRLRLLNGERWAWASIEKSSFSISGGEDRQVLRRARRSHLLDERSDVVPYGEEVET